MVDKIDYISFNDIFWVQLKEHLISFGYKGLPDGIHMTIGFDKRSKDVNLHVTKNHSSIKDKPQIKIVLIEKILLEEIGLDLLMSLQHAFLKEICIKDFTDESNSDIGFLSYSKFEKSKLSDEVLEKVIERFSDLTRIKRKSRLKIKGKVEERLNYFANDEEYLEKVLNIVEILDTSIDYGESIDSGILISNNSPFGVIRINNSWYTVNTELKIIDLLNTFLNKRLSNHLIWKTKRAIIKLKSAEKYSDTKEFNNPIRIQRLSEK
tara:strand:+ start:173 stop:967 length:795 start_codon:yes stop_codon:yes gene_type:complete